MTIKLTDVPWDLALDIILKTNAPPLAQIRESDNIVRITTSDKILDEEHKRRQLEEVRLKNLEAQQAAEPKFTRYFPISYAGQDKDGNSIWRTSRRTWSSSSRRTAPSRSTSARRPSSSRTPSTTSTRSPR